MRTTPSPQPAARNLSSGENLTVNTSLSQSWIASTFARLLPPVEENVVIFFLQTGSVERDSCGPSDYTVRKLTAYNKDFKSKGTQKLTRCAVRASQNFIAKKPRVSKQFV